MEVVWREGVPCQEVQHKVCTSFGNPVNRELGLGRKSVPSLDSLTVAYSENEPCS